MNKHICITITAIAIGTAVTLIVAAFFFTQTIYTSVFCRIETKAPFIRTPDEFNRLDVQRCPFSSDKGQTLAGYLYSKTGIKPLGIIIIAHGFGFGGQCAYMDTADYFASHGYLVFAYDATATDGSEGTDGHGFEQGTIDLSHAIDYIEHDNELKHYPIALFGHSWGAYCICSVLNVHPEIKAVISVAGFNDASEIIKYSVSDIVSFSALLTPDFWLIQHIRFGKYASYTSMSGFAHSDAAVMILHSKDDTNVPMRYGYNQYYAKYKDNARFHFKLYDDRSHLFFLYEKSAREYDKKYISEHEGTLTEYGRTHKFDKQTGWKLDAELYASMLNFIDEYCK